jgi:hypothetical protein
MDADVLQSTSPEASGLTALHKYVVFSQIHADGRRDAEYTETYEPTENKR